MIIPTVIAVCQSPFAPLEEAANPTSSPNPAKAPWYFLGLQVLVYFDPWLAASSRRLIIVGLMAIPYIDTNPKGMATTRSVTAKWKSVSSHGSRALVVPHHHRHILRGRTGTSSALRYWDPNKLVHSSTSHLGVDLGEGTQHAVAEA